MRIYACICLFLLSIVVICSVGQCRRAGHRVYTCFSIFVGNPVLAEAFCIDFLQLFYAVLRLLEFFFWYIFFCGWVLYFFNIFILIFGVVNNILIKIWFFVIYFYCYCPWRNGSLLSNCISPLLTNRLLCSSKMSFWCFCFSCSSWFILIAKLWACGSRKFKTSLSSRSFLFKKIVYLAIGSCLFFHIYLNMLFCTSKVVFVSVGKILLKKKVFDSISAFIIITFPYNDWILKESLFLCFPIYQFYHDFLV